MALDMLAVADGLATRYSALTPPTGLTAIRQSTARPPNNVPADPFVIVFLDTGDPVYRSGDRKTEHHFIVRFYLAKKSGDIGKDQVTLLRWLGVLLDATHSSLSLGVSGVSKAIPLRYAMVVLPYGGDEYAGIELTVTVWTTDTVTLTP